MAAATTAPSKTATMRIIIMPKLVQIRSILLKLAELWRYNSQQKLITYQAPLLLEYHPSLTFSMREMKLWDSTFKHFGLIKPYTPNSTTSTWNYNEPELWGIKHLTKHIQNPLPSTPLPDMWMTSVVLADMPAHIWIQDEREIYPRPSIRDGLRYREFPPRFCPRCRIIH